jgi:hypothetical protein
VARSVRRAACGGACGSSAVGRVDRVVFPPEQVAEVKAVACEPPAKAAPLSRRSVADVHRLVIERGISEASVSTIVRWLREDAIRPWQYRSWIFPTDPEFAVKAGRILDLYQGAVGGRVVASRRHDRLGR